MEFEDFRKWFYLHSIYNFVWGSLVILFPKLYFNLIGMNPPMYLPIWQVVGMFVLIYSPAYYWIAGDPKKHFHLVFIAFLGTLFGPLGFLWSIINNLIPAQFGWTIITNDLIWWPLFFGYFVKIHNEYSLLSLMKA